MESPPKPLKFAPKIALAVCIGMLDDNYKKVAYHLNDKGELKEARHGWLVFFFVPFVICLNRFMVSCHVRKLSRCGFRQFKSNFAPLIAKYT